MNDEQLDAIRKRASRATPGPWRFFVRCRKGEPFPGTLIGSVAIGHVIYTEHEGGTRPSADGEFIAAARLDVLALLEEVDCLRAEVRRQYLRFSAESEVLRALLGDLP